MIMDELLEFCDAAALDLTGTNTDLIGDVIDLQAARDIGVETKLYLVVSVDTAVDSATNTAAVEFVLASDAQAAIATDGSATEHMSTGVIPQASLGVGAMFAVPLALGLSKPYERYLGLLTKTTGEALTAGAVNAFLTWTPPVHAIYPEGQN